MYKWVCALVLFAPVAQAGTDRHTVDARLAKAVASIKTCGGAYRAVYDWASYDGLDWAKAGKSKVEWLDYEPATLGSLGEGVDHACGDPDCKAVLAKVTRIVYRVTDDDKAKRLDATIAGTTLTFTNYTFGSTRGIDDFETATKRACDDAPAATVPVAVVAAPAPVPTSKRAPVKPGRASSAWDGKYELAVPGSLAGMCPRSELMRSLIVAGGKFSLPWYADDWRIDQENTAKPVKVGRIDGVVHADGTVSTAVTFNEPVLRSNTVRTVKFKRQLDAITTVPIKFARTRGTKTAQLDVPIYERDKCRAEWEIPLPKPKPPVARTPPAKVAPAPERSEREAEQRDRDRGAEQREREQRDREYKERDARSQRQRSCRDTCETKEDQCKENRCRASLDSCKRNCEGISDFYQQDDCNRSCGADLSKCSSGCSDEQRTCEEACNNM